MVIDSSALVAIIFEEPDAGQFLRAIRSAGSRKISAAGFLETGMVLKGSATKGRLDMFEGILRDFHIAIVPITEAQARIALDAFDRYGKGRGHRAGLNFGDCFSYALAKISDEPLLFKGQDFLYTDLKFVAS